jgi:protein-tyrosine-phosphatase
MRTGSNRNLCQLFSFVLASFLLFANGYVACAKTTVFVVHDIQFILWLKDFYKGPLDGNCDAQTIVAIRQYADSMKQQFPIQCSEQLLRILIGDTREAFSSAKAMSLETTEQQGIANELSRINSRLLEIDDLRTKIQQVNESYRSELVSQFRQLATQSVAMIAVMLTGLTFIGTNLAKTLLEKQHEIQIGKIDRHHEERLRRSTELLNSMIAIARSQMAAHIFTSVGSYCSDLYMALNDPSKGYQKELYEAYINLAVDLTQYGWVNSENLRQLIGDSSAPTSKQIEILERCINNYAYFLAVKTCRKTMRQIVLRLSLASY